MPTRREIREATIQFLYCSELEGGAIAPDLHETFWDFLTETDRRNLLIATFRTVHHLAINRKDRLAEFIERSEMIKAHLAGDVAYSSLQAILKRLLALESSWSIAFTQLERLPKDGEDDETAQKFDTALESFFKIDHDLAFNRQQFIREVEDKPALRAKVEGSIASLKKLQRISDRIRMIEAPENFPEQSDLTKIRKSRADIASLREQTDHIVNSILAMKPQIDSKLAEIVENYDPERIDPVDRAILRLASYELLKTDTPPKVVINEAVELAKNYGTTDSKRFVNGLLDTLAKQVAR